MTLSEYVKKRNGVAIGSSRSLRNNLYRAFGAKNFSGFWNYWNPIFGYYLGKYIFKPLKKFLPEAIALMGTFIFCGLIHDAVTTLYRGRPSIFFSIWFFLMGLAVLITRLFKQNHAGQKWLIRALAHLTIIGICFSLTFYISRYVIIV